MGKGKVLRIFDTKAVRIPISKRCYIFVILNKADLINVSWALFVLQNTTGVWEPRNGLMPVNFASERH